MSLLWIKLLSFLCCTLKIKTNTQLYLTEDWLWVLCWDEDRYCSWGAQGSSFFDSQGRVIAKIINHEHAGLVWQKPSSRPFSHHQLAQPHTPTHVCVSRSITLTKSITAFPRDHDPLLTALVTTAMGHRGEGPIRILSHLHRAAHQGQESQEPGGLPSETWHVLLSPAKVWGQFLRNLPPQAEPQTRDPPQPDPTQAGVSHSFRGAVLS